MAWAQLYPACTDCGRTDVRHAGKGLCTTCRERRARNHSRSVEGRGPRELTAEVLGDLYLNQGMTLEEIGRRHRLSRQAVFYRMKRLGISRRTMSGARVLALETKAIEVETKEVDGEKGRRVLVRRHANSSLFETWSPAMAYALGVIATDGCLHESRRGRDGSKTVIDRVSVAQKEPELLEKVLAILESNAALRFQPRRVSPSGVVAGDLWTFTISDRRLVEDLFALGITPRKSKSLRFPQVPAPLMRHFVRGCWDGDGSVYRDGGDGIFASYVTASRHFAEGLVSALSTADIGTPTLHQDRGVYTFRLSGRACARLFQFLYRGVDRSLYLERKHLVFVDWMNDHELRECESDGVRWVALENHWLELASEHERKVKRARNGWRRNEQAARETWTTLDSASRDGRLQPDVIERFRAKLVSDGKQASSVSAYVRVARKYATKISTLPSDSVLPEEFLEAEARGASEATLAQARSVLLALQRFIAFG